jgi:NAD(P)-dependent dehydrogenase (short-subunit alcohol dehydrogenase family)
MVLKCDVTSWEEQEALFAAGYAKYGKIDYVVPNAGKRDVIVSFLYLVHE